MNNFVVSYSAPSIMDSIFAEVLLNIFQSNRELSVFLHNF